MNILVLLEYVRAKGVVWAGQFLSTFHAMGIISQLYIPLAAGCPAAHFAPQHPATPVIPTPRNTLDTAKMMGCTAIVAIPMFIEARLV